MIRNPAVAGQFYPGDKETLTAMVADLMESTAATEPRKALAVISPHAGYIYSGKVAGETFAKVFIPEDVLILGPNHHGVGAALSLMVDGVWEMPMGPVNINRELSELVVKHARHVEINEQAHRFEHSLEVQVPFLQFRQKKLSLTPLVVSRVPLEICLETGAALARAIKELNRPVLMVASTDMTHYESRQSASQKDRMALDEILGLDPAGLYNTVDSFRISMCGIIPTTIVLAAALSAGATKTELVRYTDSGETSGDTDQVVGYAGFVIS